MKLPRWLRSDAKPRLREEKIIEDMDANAPRTPHGSYRLREEKEDPKIKEAAVRHQRPREGTLRFRKEPVVIDEKSIVRHTRAKSHLRHLRQEQPATSNKEVRAKSQKKLDPAQYARLAEIERRLIKLRRPNQNTA